MSKQNFGMIGLGVMGRNLTMNIERNGFSVVGFDKDINKDNTALKDFEGKNIIVTESIEEFLKNLEKPHIIMIQVPAGNPVDSVIGDLKPHLSRGDVIIDGGNSFFKDTNLRNEELKKDDILYIGAGVSGGEMGALFGPSIMPGGNPDAWSKVKPILQAISAKVDNGTPCCDWIGSGGAGHFVKMVHNGIEYSDMQMICEAYFLMDKFLKLTPEEMKVIFADWNEGELNSYLIEITSRIMAKKDPETGNSMINIILDTAGQKGTGKWTSKIALDLGIPAQTIAEAVFARTLSAAKEERVAAAKELKGPSNTFKGNKKEFIEKIRKALYASKICSYAQGFQLIRAASKEYNWDIKIGNLAMIWRGGCIIQAQFLDRIIDAYESNPNIPNLLLDTHFKSVMESYQNAWRDVVVQAINLGVPVPAFSSALSYYDGYRSSRLPANLLQAQRDYFGAHKYERVDRPRNQFFHTDWLKD